ncbi:MAG TPA: hypothetical protein VF131_19505 [Blastocatellia bacterium]|nr:hypothetical protein [Blastocatellia bacterium]
MKLMKVSTIVLLLAVSLAAIGCAENSQSAGPPSTTATQNAQEVEKDDGSIVATTTATDGTKTEVRTFKTGEVARVTRTTSPGRKRTATVELRDGRKADLEDDSEIEQVIDASADWIADTANDTWDTTKAVGKEVGDKTEDVADKTVDTSKKVVKGTKAGAKEVGDKAEDVGDAVGKTAKKVGKGAKNVGKKVKDKVTP